MKIPAIPRQLRLPGVLAAIALYALTGSAAIEPPAGFTALFNGQDLTGWRGGDTSDHRKYLALPTEQRARQDADWTADMLKHWRVEGDELVNDGLGKYATTRDYGDFELRLEYKTVARADSGVYLRGCPQVQIWDYTDETKFKLGADKGSGGLWNNSPGTPGKDPLVKADKPFGEWNQVRIIMVGSRVSVWLNEQLVVNHAVMENYYDRKTPVPAKGPIQLQTHGGEIRWRNLFIREIGADEANQILARHGEESGFKPIFSGTNLEGWAGPLDQYEIENGAVVCKSGQGGTIYYRDELADFTVRFEFKLPPGGNNGLAIRYPGQGDTAYVGMCELQVLDSEHPKYAKSDPRQHHGSAYGIAAAHRGYLRPTGEWNFQEVTVRGSTIRVELNGTVILDTDLAKITTFLADKAHPGKDRTTGYFGFAGHNDPVAYRNVRLRKL